MRRLLDAGFAFPASVAMERAVMAYGVALSGLSASALQAVCLRLMRGEFERHREFLPKPAELAAMVRAQHQAMAEDLRRARETRDTLCALRAPRQTPEPDLDAKRRVRALVERTTKALRAERLLDEARRERALNELFGAIEADGAGAGEAEG